MRVRQVLLLVRPSLRTVAWPALIPAGAVGLALLRLDGDEVLLLRLAGMALCVAAAFALDDAAADTTASTPAPLLFRRAVRLALVLPLVGATWAVLLTLAGDVPAGALTLELASMLAFALAASALAVGLAPDGRGGLAGGPALLAFLAAAALALPDAWTLFAASPADPRWGDSHGRWAIVLALGTLALVRASLDPGRRRRLPRLGRRGNVPAAAVEAAERA